MATTQAEIREWCLRGITEDATHMIVVTDTFDWEDYPVYVSKTQNVKEIEEKYDGSNMQKVMEVYNLQIDLEPQLNEIRSFNY